VRAILTYHSVDSSGSPISIDEAAFRAHVRWLVSGTVRVVPLAQITSPEAGNEAVALTFDDGFANFADAAWPLLRERGLPATLFVVSGHVGGTNAWGGRDAAGIPTLPLMDWDGIARAVAEGVTVGAHTRTHPDLRAVSDAALEDELGGAAEAIAEHTGVRPDAVAYPYGGVSDAVGGAAARHFRQGCTTELRLLTDMEPPLLLPRLDAYYLRDPGRLEAWGTPAFRRRLRVRAGLRRVRAAIRGGSSG